MLLLFLIHLHLLQFDCVIVSVNELICLHVSALWSTGSLSCVYPAFYPMHAGICSISPINVRMGDFTYEYFLFAKLQFIPEGNI